MIPLSPIPCEPLDRFRLIYDALNDERGWWSDASPLRFAAVAAMTCPGEPRDVAAGIRRLAEDIRAHAGIFGVLNSQLRFIVAAMLLQHGDDPEGFLEEVKRVRKLFREVGIRGDATHETMTVLMLRIKSGLVPIERETVARFRAIYEQMKRYHWWLTGPADFPACAMLASEDESPEIIGATIETIFRAIQASGFGKGDPVQNASNILYMAKLDADLVAQRFAGLALGFRSAGVSIWQSDYDELAILSFLNHATQRVIDRVLANRRLMETLSPKPDRSLTFNLASSVTFLELVQLDENMKHITAGKALVDMQAIISAQQAACAASAACAAAAASAST